MTRHTPLWEVVVLPSREGRRFEPEIRVRSFDSYVTVAACDLDHDSHLDLLAAGYSDQIQLLRNDGSGRFELAGRWGVGESPGSVIAADLTEDGWADLAVGSRYAVGNEWRDRLWLLTSHGPDTPPLAARMDIRPGACPNPLHPGAQGVLPVAVLGGEGLDVRAIDPTTLRLEGVRPLRSEYRDASAPASGGSACECGPGVPDGMEDLLLDFDAEAVSRALPSRVHKTVLRLALTGRMWSGQPLEASDCATVVGAAARAPLDVIAAPGASLQTVRFDVPQPSPVTLEVFDIQGRKVRRLLDGVTEQGTRELRWDAGALPPGLYFYRLRLAGGSLVAKLVLTR